MATASPRTSSRGKQLSFAAIILCALILLAIFMPNYFQNLQQATAPFVDQDQASIEAQRAPDSYGKNMLLQTFSATGNVQYQVQAASMQQYLGDKSTNLQTPLITLNNEGSSPWIIKANDGLIKPSNDGLAASEKVLILNGAVSVTQNLSGNDFVRLRSEALTVYPDSQTARTEHTVIVETSAFRTQALGVLIDLSSGRIEFPKNPHQRVRSTIMPTPDLSTVSVLSAPLAQKSEYSGLKQLHGSADA